MGKVLNLKNKKFGRLIALNIVGKNKRRLCIWRCRCSCGNIVDILSYNLKSGITKSCGCYKKDILTTQNGESKTRLYSIFKGIAYRCNSPKENSYKHYGGRGIKCQWESFKEFRDDMYESYLEHVEEFGEKNTTIDRIDTDGNYSKDNCRWATWEEQRGNKRNNHLLTFRGKTQHARKWARECDIGYELLLWRIKKGWSIEKALTTKPRKWLKKD